MRPAINRAKRPALVAPSTSRAPLRVALILKLRPNKRGSLEQWILEFCEQSRQRGHYVEIFTASEILPEIRSSLESVGVRWRDLAEIEPFSWSSHKVLRRFDLIQLHFVSLREPLAFAAYLAFPAKVVWVDHNSSPAVSSRRTPLALFADRMMLPRVAKIVCVSKYVQERARARFRASSKISLIYNGVDTNRFSPRPRARRSELRLLCAAHLIHDKGVDVLLSAARLLPDIELRITIAGAGREERSLRSQAVTLGMSDKVTFAGLRSDLEELLHDHDLFIHPARWHEAFGLTVAEALAAGVPIIASNVGAIPELVEHNESGLLVPPENPEALAEAIRRMASDEVLYRRCAANGRLRAVERFGLNECVTRHVELTEEIGGAV